jgi:acetyltransferase-like isoleucine patch superfamily enzyme
MALRALPGALVQLAIGQLEGPMGEAVRYRYWRRRLGSLGRNVRIDPGVYFQSPRDIHIGDDCWIDRGAMLLAGADRSARAKRRIDNPAFDGAPGEIRIGRGVHVGAYSIVSGIGGVRIGDECTLSAGVKLYSFSHHYRSDADPGDRSVRFGSRAAPDRQFLIEGPVVLEDNVGVALHAVVLPGVVVARDSFVKAGSVVSRSVPENSLVDGSPARRIGERFR